MPAAKDIREKSKGGSKGQPKDSKFSTSSPSTDAQGTQRLIMYDKGPRISNLAICLEQWHHYIVSTYGPGGDFIETMDYKSVQMPKWSTYNRQVNQMPDSSFLDSDDDESDTLSISSGESDKEDGNDGDAALSEDVQAMVKKRRKALVQRLFDKAVDESVKQEAIWR